jgi:type II secretory pathway component PulC
MNDNLRKKVVFAILPLAIFWAVYNYPSKETILQPPAPEATVTAKTPLVAPSVQATVRSTPAIDVEARRKEPWGDDPFRSPGHYSPRQSDGNDESTSLAWALAGIIYSDQSPIALVNSHMVGVGDKVGSATVVAITRESVTLEYQGRSIILKLHKG